MTLDAVPGLSMRLACREPFDAAGPPGPASQRTAADLARLPRHPRADLGG